MNSHPRIQQLFSNPQFQGTDDEWERLKQVEVHTAYGLDGIVDITCPYCTWINIHNVKSGGGYRACDGPVKTKYTARGAMRKNWKRYDCPGYTLVLQ